MFWPKWLLVECLSLIWWRRLSLSVWIAELVHLLWEELMRLLVSGSCNTLKTVVSQELLLRIQYWVSFWIAWRGQYPWLDFSSGTIYRILLLSRKEAKGKYESSTQSLYVELIFALGACYLFQLNFTWILKDRFWNWKGESINGNLFLCFEVWGF